MNINCQNTKIIYNRQVKLERSIMMDENEKKDDFEENAEPKDDISNQTPENKEENDYKTDSAQENGTACDAKNQPRYESNNYNPYSYNVGNYSQQTDQGKNTSKKLLVAVIAVILAAGILLTFAGVGLMNVIGNYITDNFGEGSPNNGGGNGGGGGSGNVDASDITNSDFDLAQNETAGQKYPSLADAYDATHKTFVEINTVSETDGTAGAGSGVIVARMAGNVGYYIVTNHHVVDGATEITVELYDGTKYTAHDMVLKDEMTDLAVIAIIESKELQVAKIGKSDNLRVGEDVYVIGNPLGTLGGTLTDGIISAQAVEIYIGNHFMDLIQTNTAINPGNSGGPMFNMSGELVGIVNAKYADVSVEGIGFAIPIDTAIDIVEQMVRQGYVAGRHDLGIVTTQNLYGTGGLWISELSADSALIKAGMPYNSLYCYRIEAINNYKFDSSQQAQYYIDNLKAGEKITVSVSIYRFSFSSLQPVTSQTYNITLSQKLATE